MSFVATAIIGAGTLGAGASIFAASKQTSAANKAIGAETGMFNTARGVNQPFVDQGTQAASTLGSLLAPGADMSSILKTIPGFQFLSNITQQGVANQGTTTGLGGNTLIAGANAGSNIALNAGWNPIVNSLQGLVNSGVAAGGNVSTAATAAGGQIGSANIGIGNAQGGAATSVGSNIGNSVTSAALLSKLLGNNNMYGPQSANTGAPGGGYFGPGGVINAGPGFYP